MASGGVAVKWLLGGGRFLYAVDEVKLKIWVSELWGEFVYVMRICATYINYWV